MKSIQPSRRDFGSGGIFPGVITPGCFQASFPDAKTDGTCEPPADEVAPKRSLEKQMVADATNMPALTGLEKPVFHPWLN
jgi:hypothetical protein